MEKRSRPAVKVLKPFDLEPPKFQRKIRNRISIPINTRNVFGLPRETEKLFPTNQNLYPKVASFIQKYALPDTDSKQNLEKTLPVRRERPHFTMIYRDSEGNEENEDYQINSPEEVSSENESSYHNSSHDVSPSAKSDFSFTRNNYGFASSPDIEPLRNQKFKVENLDFDNPEFDEASLKEKHEENENLLLPVSLNLSNK